MWIIKGKVEVIGVHRTQRPSRRVVVVAPKPDRLVSDWFSVVFRILRRFVGSR
jgi:hypothetical protein